MTQYNYVNWNELNTRLISEITGVDASSARRYIRQRRAPVPVIRLLLLYLNGHILPPAWCGLSRFEGEWLVVDESERLSLSQYRAQFFYNQNLRAQLASVQRRLERLTQLEAQPLPKQPALYVVAPSASAATATVSNEHFMRRFVR